MGASAGANASMLPSRPSARTAPRSSKQARTTPGANTAGPAATAPCMARNTMSTRMSFANTQPSATTAVASSEPTNSARVLKRSPSAP